MKNRKDIKDIFKWDLKVIYSSDEKASQEIQNIKNQVKLIEDYKGKLGEKKSLLNFLSLTSELSCELEKLGGYSYLKRSEDLSVNKYNALFNEVQNLENKMSVATSFVDSELISYGEDYLNNLLADKTFVNHHLYMRELLRNKAHTLSEIEETLLSKSEKFAGEFSVVFDNIDALDVKFNDIVSNKPLKLNNSNYRLFLESKNREIRKQAFNNLHRGYMSLENTIASNYIASVKSDTFYSDVYKYNSTLEMSLNGGNIPEKLYYNLIENVDKNVNLLHRYYELKKKFLKLDKMHYYDTYVSLATLSKSYTYEQMSELVFNALKPLGDDYVQMLKTSVNNNWIDVYPNTGKATGAYCLGIHSVHPYVMLNTVNNLDSVFTMAHELGHAMHSYYSSLTQPFELSHYPIFLAEIASTTNEILLLKYLYANAKTKQEKLYYLDKYLSMFKSTLFRQTMFSEFEDYAHKQIEKDVPLTKNMLVDYYAQLNKKYHGKSVVPCKEISYEWLRIPHFYSCYYVYKYATGITSAIVLASNILNRKEGALQKYRDFLSSGGCDYPTKILKKAGVDLTTNIPYDIAFAEMKWAIQELSKLL